MDDRDKVLLLGDPRLRQPCQPVVEFHCPEFKEHGRRLVGALERFRAENGFGRAIAAPQLGIPFRMVAMNLGGGPHLLVNPELTSPSVERFTLWDDCMSFPWLMIRLQRHLSVDLRYQDERGELIFRQRVERDVSELLQHEVDHLDGILALDRADDRDSVIARELYLERKPYFDSFVDYVIRPTVRRGLSERGSALDARDAQWRM
jgi:peptide deformylase